MGSTEQAVRFRDVFKEELIHIRKRREKRHQPQREVTEDLVGLAFSGGGIRSATFGLGVLEALRRCGLLRKVDYLSTVSGGGYIGAWLSANCARASKDREWLDPAADWTESTAHLRRYSNYLAPKLGFFSADTWSMFTIWFRNTILIQLTVILAIAVVLLVPRPLFEGFLHWPDTGYWRWSTVVLCMIGVAGIAGNQIRVNQGAASFLLQRQSWLYGLGAAAVLTGVAYSIAATADFTPFANGEVSPSIAFLVALPLAFASITLLPAALKFVNRFWPGSDAPEQINYSQSWVQWLVVMPMMLTGYMVGAILWRLSQDGGLSSLNSFDEIVRQGWRYWPFPLSVAAASFWVVSFSSVRRWGDWKGLLAAFFAPFPSVGLLHVLLSWILLLLRGWADRGEHANAYIWSPALVLFAFSLALVMLIGMMGRQSTEGVREWWSRLGAWMCIFGFAWMVVSVVAVFGPQWFAAVFDGQTWKHLSATGGWLGTTAAGLLAGNSGRTGKEQKSGPNFVLELVAVVAPFVFIAGLLVAISAGLAAVLGYGENPSLFSYVLGGCLGGLMIMAARVDINQFSLNQFYRNRLVRCYLGATRYRPGERQPQNFTGFDDDDDLEIATLATAEHPAPLHIINCALNLGGSSDLALHTRHSASFTVSPLYSGTAYESKTQTGLRKELGFIRTNVYGGSDGQPTLGQAISVSGAAASPNMGYHTSSVIAFLLTIFNVRLGWWFPNPRAATDSPSPWFSLRYLISELFGGANDKSSYMMISDGGHFENLAAYELIRRRCRVVIISDAECDPDLKFEGLGTLIRMCEVDFGAKIHLDVRSIRREGSAWSSSRCAAGRIEYADAPPGVLIYLKASMTGHEDSAILQYKNSHPAFPHESTGNQFYGEDQFESYRALGREIAQTTFEPASEEEDILELAHRLLKIWSPTLDHAERFTKHSTRLADLWSKLSANSSLKELDRELVGEAWPTYPDGFRSVFYLCSEMLQLMENVYVDLELEHTWMHPDNFGWREQFIRWAGSPGIQKTWSITHANYGLRFQYFCERNLGLRVPEKSSVASA